MVAKTVEELTVNSYLYSNPHSGGILSSNTAAAVKKCREVSPLSPSLLFPILYYLMEHSSIPSHAKKHSFTSRVYYTPLATAMVALDGTVFLSYHSR
jgi:hypothetical protein